MNKKEIKKLITLIFFFTCSKVCHGSYIEQLPLDPLPKTAWSLYTVRTSLALIHTDLYDRLAVFGALLHNYREQLDFIFWLRALPIKHIRDKEQQLSAAYYAAEQTYLESSSGSDDPWPLLSQTLNRLRLWHDTDQTRFQTYEKICRWYSIKLLLLESFRHQFPPLHCSCTTEQREKYHSDVIVNVFNLLVDRMTLIGSNMIESIGKPFSNEKALWSIPLCLVTQKRALFTIEKNNHVYQWLVYPFTSTNLELHLTGRLDTTQNPVLHQIDEKKDHLYEIRLLLINHFKPLSQNQL